MEPFLSVYETLETSEICDFPQKRRILKDVTEGMLWLRSRSTVSVSASEISNYINTKEVAGNGDASI